MKLAFRTQAKRDLRWFSFYYAQRFPEGRKQAEQRFRDTIKLVLGNPHAGKRLDGVDARKRRYRERHSCWSTLLQVTQSMSFVYGMAVPTRET